VFKKNSGIDPFAKFFARARLLKKYDAFGSEMGHENMDGEEDQEYYDVDGKSRFCLWVIFGVVLTVI
jgi:hypothetical protein